MGILVFGRKETRAKVVTKATTVRVQFVSFVMGIYGAEFQEHCFNISRDIVYSVLTTFQLQYYGYWKEGNIVTVFQFVSWCRNYYVNEFYIYQDVLNIKQSKIYVGLQSIAIQICPGLNASDIQISYDKHHSVFIGKKSPKHTKLCQM